MGHTRAFDHELAGEVRRELGEVQQQQQIALTLPLARRLERRVARRLVHFPTQRQPQRHQLLFRLGRLRGGGCDRIADSINGVLP